MLFAVIIFITFLIALHYNDLFLLTEVGGTRLVRFVWRQSQMTHQLAIFRGACTEPDEENRDQHRQLITTSTMPFMSDWGFGFSHIKTAWLC